LHRWGTGAVAAVCLAWLACVNTGAALAGEPEPPSSSHSPVTRPPSRPTEPAGATGATGAAPLAFRVYARTATRIDSLFPVPPIPAGFVGTSMDYCAITAYSDGGANTVLAHLLSALSPQPVIRIGGNGPDDGCPGIGPRPVSVAADAVAALAQRTGARLVLGINLLAHNIARAVSEVRGLVAAIDPQRPFRYIEAFEIGNEPDRYPQYGPSAPRDKVKPYFEQYLRDFADWAHVIRLAADNPDVGIAGPSLGRLGLPWITGAQAGDFGAFLRTPSHPSLITFHSYPLHGTARCPARDCPSIPNLLANHSSVGLANQVAPFVGRLPRGRALRVDEVNSVTGGGAEGVSNTFASALWALDTLFEFAKAGVSGVNVHTFPGARYALYDGPSGGWRVFPEYYGMLAFARAAPAGASLLAVSGGLADRAVKVWATRSATGRLTTVVINKSLRAAEVQLSGAGVPSRSSATLVWLRAPATGERRRCPRGYASTGLCAIDGVTLGGASFGPPASLGGDRTTTGVLGKAARGTCTRLLRCVRQPPGSAITLTMAPGTAVLIGGSARQGA
jgi:hypothetical protein